MQTKGEGRDAPRASEDAEAGVGDRGEAWEGGLGVGRWGCSALKARLDKVTGVGGAEGSPQTEALLG